LKYLEYEQYKAKYLDVVEIFNELLTEKTGIIGKVLPKAITYDKDITTTGVPDDNPLESYVMELEKSKVDIRLDQTRKILEDRKMLLDFKEQELRRSQETYDRIYCMRFLDGLGAGHIAGVMHFSKSQVYRIIDQIEKKLGIKTKDATKCDKMRQNAKMDVV